MPDALPLGEFAQTPQQLIARAALMQSKISDPRIETYWQRFTAVIDADAQRFHTLQESMQLIRAVPVPLRVDSPQVAQAIERLLDAVDGPMRAALATECCHALGWYAPWLAEAVNECADMLMRAKILGRRIDLTTDLERRLQVARLEYERTHERERKAWGTGEYIAWRAQWWGAIYMKAPGSTTTVSSLGRDLLAILRKRGEHHEDGYGRTQVQHGIAAVAPLLGLQKITRSNVVPTRPK